MKSTIILLAPDALTGLWRKTITSGARAIICDELVFATGVPESASREVVGDGAGQLLVMPSGAYVSAGLRLVRARCPELSIVLVEAAAGGAESAKKVWLSFDGPPGTTKPVRSPGAIRRTQTVGDLREPDEWTERFRDLFESAVPQDISSGTGMSLYAAVGRFLSGHPGLGLRGTGPAELRARRLMTISSRYRGQVPL